MPNCSVSSNTSAESSEGGAGDKLKSHLKAKSKKVKADKKKKKVKKKKKKADRKRDRSQSPKAKEPVQLSKVQHRSQQQVLQEHERSI